MDLKLQNLDETKELAESIARCCAQIESPCVIYLIGDLGVGKTTFAQFFIRFFGFEKVKSPTYTLCEEYELDELLFLHIDLYRSGDAEDIDLFDLDRDIKKQKIILIEWPEKLFSERKPDVEIYLEHAKEMREVSVKIFSN